MNCNTNPLKAQKVTQSKRTIQFKNHIQPGNDFSLTMSCWIKVSQLKQMIRKETGVPVPDMRLVFKNIELHRNNIDIQEYDIKKNSVIHLMPRTSLKTHYMINALEIIDETTEEARSFHEVKSKVEAALNSGIVPKLTDFGTQGTYFLESIAREPLAVFKPHDEEAFAPNNPRGYKGKFSTPGLRPGVLSGEGVDREVAAFLIDQAYGGYHGVPITTYVEFSHPSFKTEDQVIYQPDSQTTEIFEQKVPMKRGSFQLYVKHQDCAGNYGSSLFSVEQAHKIAILDLRIMNCDRNEENILVKKRKVSSQSKTKQAYDFYLLPIDHGYSFPDSFNICQEEVVWFHWDQMRQPFSKQEMEFINSINPENDVKLILDKLKFRKICLRNFRIAQTFLKAGAQGGLNLYQIAQLAFREDSEEMSHLEKAVQRAEEIYKANRSIPSAVTNGSNTHKHTKITQKISINGRNPGKKVFQANLQLITEEGEIIEESKLDQKESPEKTPDFKMMKRSISQPSLLLTRQASSQNENKDQDDSFDEDFYPHIQFQIGILIEQKLKECSGKKTYRDRYRSHDLS